jgi:transposase
MGYCYGNDLRCRVIEAIDGGLSARAAAARFSVAPSTAINWHRQWRERGTIVPARQGKPPRSSLDAHEAFILGLVEETKDIALPEIAERLVDERGLRVHPTTIWYFLSKRGLTHKKRRGTRRSKSARMSRPGAKTGSTVRSSSTRNA